jgi:hypothetical protein
MTLNTVPGCEFCDKRGLPVLVARYALAPVTAGAPKTRALHLDGKTEFPAPGTSAHYTRRLLRGGYLYVHDEARKRWEGYFITEDAYLMRFEVGKPLPKSFTSDKQPCTQTGHQQVAGMVTIADPNKATRVWFGFSDVEWTDAVLQKHEDADYRKKHMQVLDVKAALAGGKQENVHPLKALGSKVAEYACDPLKATAPGAFYDAPYHFAPRKLQLEETLNAADALRKGQGVILSLHDPVAMAIEIAVQANHLLANHLELDKQDKIKSRKIAVSSAILQLRNSVMENAEKSVVDDAEMARNLSLSITASSGYVSESQLKRIEALGVPSEAEIRRGQAAAWRRYTHRESGRARFNEATVEAFYTSYQQELQTFRDEHIDPLGEVHVAWTTSKHMENCMTCNFDPADIKSGAAYTQTVAKVTHGTEAIRACFNQYEKWLNSNECKADNLLLRAMVYNNDALAKQVSDATAFDSRAIPWDGLAASYKKAVEVLSSDQATVAAALMGRMMGPMAKAGGYFVDGASKLVFTILGMHSGLGWTRVSFEGSRKEFRAFLARQIFEASDVPLSEAQIKVAVAREIKLAAIRGERLEGRGTFKWVAMRQRGTTTLRTPSSLNEIRFQKFGQVISADIRLGVSVGILQYVCLTKTIADQSKALEGDLAEANSRLAAGLIGVTGTICETIGATIKGMGNVGFRWAQGLTAVKWVARVEFCGRILGLAGAAIMAIWDFLKFYDEGQKGNYVTAGLYGASGIAGLAVAILLMSGFGPWALAAIAIYLCVVFILEKTKDNAIQSWIENSIFGIGNSYNNAEIEMRELSKALS